MVNSYKAFCLVVLLTACAPLTLAQGTYTQFDVPGAAKTLPWGINAAGDISGSYLDGGGNYHGFLLSNGAYTTIDYPGAQTTELFGLNDVGQIVGAAIVGSASVGFVYDLQTQIFTQVSYPGTTSQTDPYGINNAGTISGSYLAIVGTRTRWQGFELVGSAYSTIAPNMHSTLVWGINAAGTVVGNSLSTNFRFNDGRFRVIPLPNAQYLALGISNFGVIVGQENSTGQYYGFLYANNTLTYLQFPGSAGSVASQINDSGVVVGNFWDANFVNHGYTWTP